MKECTKCGQDTQGWCKIDNNFFFCYDCWSKGITEKDLKGIKTIELKPKWYYSNKDGIILSAITDSYDTIYKIPLSWPQLKNITFLDKDK